MARTVKDISITAHLQKELLCSAVDSVDVSGPGRIIGAHMFSQCTGEPEVVNYILKKRCMKLVPTGLSFGKPGFTRFQQKRFHPSLNLTRRFYPHVHNCDGFYVAKLYKYANGSPEDSKVNSASESEPESEQEEEEVVEKEEQQKSLLLLKPTKKKKRKMENDPEETKETKKSKKKKKSKKSVSETVEEEKKG